MLKEIVIHIGQTKTASTSLQLFLAGNKKFLYENGVTYLDFPNPKKAFSHRYIFNLLMANNAIDKEQKDHHRKRLNDIFKDSPSELVDIPEEFFINSLKNCSTERGMVSEELLWHLGEFDQELRRACLNNFKHLIHSALPDVRIKIIAYVRPQDSWLESWHNQLVKDRYLQNSIRQMLLRYLKLNVFNYPHIIGDWLDIIEPDAVVIRPFIQGVFSNDSIYEDFLNNGLGLVSTSNCWYPGKKLQTSIHPTVCAFVIRNKPSINEDYKNALQKMSDYAKQFPPFKNVSFTLLKAEERKNIKEQTLTGNKDLSRQFNLNCNLSDFFRWDKVIVPLPLPSKVRREFDRIMKQPAHFNWSLYLKQLYNFVRNKK